MTSLATQIAQARELARMGEAPGSVPVARTAMLDQGEKNAREGEWLRIAVRLYEQADVEYD